LVKKNSSWILGGVILFLVLIVIALFALSNCSSTSHILGDWPFKIAEDTQKPAPLVYPLTGAPAPDEATAQQRILSVKIENSPEARPQLGITSADVVYESITEAGISRFNCLFQSNVPADVGPVRSGRNSDVTIVPQYDALFFMSGANPLVESQIAAAGIVDMYHQAAGDMYYRVDYRDAPHNLYLRLGDAYQVAADNGKATSSSPIRKLDFIDPEAAATGSGIDTAATGDITSITVPFSDAYAPNWTYDAGSKTYARSLDGPTIDAANDQQVAVTNLIVVWADYIPVAGGPTLAVDMNKGDRASVFFGGKRYDGTWSSDGANPPRFKDANGTEIKLMPGKTWISVQSNAADIVAQ
jgi:hypothetical protein